MSIMTEGAGGEKFRLQDGKIIFGRTAGGIFLPALMAADGSLVTSGGGSGVASAVSVNDSVEAGTAQTPSWTKVVVDGSVAAGAKTITVVASSDFTGTVGGTEFLPNTAMTWRAELGHRLAALAYTRSAGSLYIGKVV